MTWRSGRSLAMVVVAALALGTACSAAEPSEPSEPDDVFGDSMPKSRVKIDTPELRRMKQDAGIEPCPASDADREPVDAGLPAVSLPCLGGGRPVHLHGLRDVPTVVNIWASWCGPCRRELPVLQEFYERAKGEVSMLGVDFEDPQPGQALAMLDELGVTYPQVADFDKAVQAGIGRTAVPMTLLVDENGTVVKRLPFEITSDDQLAEEVSTALGVDL
ncbi:MAG: redoxin family protein [Propionibacteriales bacterium]|nr:redoxin family protein [Propionibacteriales bacterium]